MDIRPSQINVLLSVIQLIIHNIKKELNMNKESLLPGF